MGPTSRILVIDDDESMRIGCVQTLNEEGYHVQAAENGELGLALAQKEAFDLVILDLRMPGMDGMEVLAKLKENDPGIFVIVITGYATIESAVDAMKQGACDFLPKPFSPEALLAIVSRDANRKRLTMENACLRLELNERMGADAIIGRSPEMMKVAGLVEKVAPTDSTVLIRGETGVGKELIAKAIHRHSQRRDKPFVVVDCGALVETLFESELFGHVRGSFTGATETTYGKFELANGGTIFLDEIANVGTNVQAKLLRVIQEREIAKVGSSRKIEVDVRILAATNQDLATRMREGEFREDLFYRLNVVPIHLPPLRERKDDIGLLSEYFLKKFREERKRNITGISREALRSLEAYDWPGNVRELENAIERAVVMADGEIVEVDDLLYYGLGQAAVAEPAEGGRLAEVEKTEIANALRKFDGHRSNAAEYLGINRKTLREKIRKHSIDVAP